MTGMELLAAYNVAFVATFILGLMFMVLALMGLGDHDADVDVSADHDFDHDIGHDVEHDHDHDADAEHNSNLWNAVLSLLGIGRCPLSIIIMSFLFLFSGLGMIMNILLKPILITPILFGSISHGGAFLGALFLTGSLARLIGKLMPTKETNVETKASFAGKLAKALFNIDCGKTSFIMIKDQTGSCQEVQARNIDSEQPIHKNDTVLIIKYDIAEGVFHVRKADDNLSLKLG